MPAGFYLEIHDTLWAMGNEGRSTVARFPLRGGTSTIVDRNGGGPGEFVYADEVQLHPGGDTLVLFHENRLSYWTPNMLEVRSVPTLIQSPAGMLVMSNGTLFVDPSFSKFAPASGYALHRFDPSGRHLVSFRQVGPETSGDDWPVASGTDPQTVWLVEPRATGFSVEQWDFERAKRTRVFQIAPTWWVSERKGPGQYEQMASDKVPMTQLPSGPQAVYDSGDVLWLVVRHFDRDHAGADFAHYEPHRWFDGILLALDRSTGSILAAHVFDEFPFGFTNQGNLILYDADAADRPRLTLVALRLSRAR